MDKKRAVLYARCSTGRQAEKDLSIPAQLKALRRYAEQHNYIVVAEKVDAGKSGRKLEGRDALAEILELAGTETKELRCNSGLEVLTLHEKTGLLSNS